MVVMAVSGTVRSSDKPFTAGYRLPDYCEERDEDGCDGGLWNCQVKGQAMYCRLQATRLLRGEG